jgi:hypothetical protein
VVDCTLYVRRTLLPSALGSLLCLLGIPGAPSGTNGFDPPFNVVLQHFRASLCRGVCPGTRAHALSTQVQCQTIRSCADSRTVDVCHNPQTEHVFATHVPMLWLRSRLYGALCSGVRVPRSDLVGCGTGSTERYNVRAQIYMTSAPRDHVQRQTSATKLQMAAL